MGVVLALLFVAVGAPAQAQQPQASPIVNADGSTTVVAAPLGPASDAARIENRWMTHSDLQPTGRFIRAGETMEVLVVGERIPTDTRVVMGLIGLYDEHSAGQRLDLAEFRVDAPQMSITAPHDGMVFASNLATDHAATLLLAGGTPVPTWIRGQTTRADSEAQVARYPAAPFFEMISDRVFGDFQVDAVGAAILSSDIDSVLGQWDHLVELTDSVYGLSRVEQGINHRWGHRIFISNPDSGFGYASASNDRIEFQNETNAGVDLFSGQLRQRGLWHEIGHTYQTPQYTWTGLSEVTVNLSALAIERELIGTSRLDETIPAANAYFYGPEFYPRLSQYYRERVAAGVPDPQTDEEMIQAFILSTSRVVQRNLTPFFAESGLVVLPETAAELDDLPILSVPLWENISSDTPIVDYLLGAEPTAEAPFAEPEPQLAPTGSDASPGVAAAVLLVLGGAVAIEVVRRRRWAGPRS